MLILCTVLRVGGKTKKEENVPLCTRKAECAEWTKKKKNNSVEHITHNEITDDDDFWGRATQANEARMIFSVFRSPYSDMEYA